MCHLYMDTGSFEWLQSPKSMFSPVPSDVECFPGISALFPQPTSVHPFIWAQRSFSYLASWGHSSPQPPHTQFNTGPHVNFSSMLLFLQSTIYDLWIYIYFCSYLMFTTFTRLDSIWVQGPCLFGLPLAPAEQCRNRGINCTDWEIHSAILREVPFLLHWGGPSTSWHVNSLVC